MLEVLEGRLNFFESMGCRASDHAIAYVPYAVSTSSELERNFQKGQDKAAPYNA
jgi:glucuronate isomerase